VAPVGVKMDETGRFRLAFGAALGSYQETSTDCDGNVLDRQNFKFHTVGGEAEAYVAPKIRLTAHAGNMTTTPGVSDQGQQLAGPFQGFFGGALLAYEGEKSGI